MLLTFIVSIILLLLLNVTSWVILPKRLTLVMKSGFGTKVQQQQQQQQTTVQRKSKKLTSDKKGISLTSTDIETNIQNRINNVKNLRRAMELQQEIDNFSKLTQMMSPLERTLIPPEKLVLMQSRQQELKELQEGGFTKQNILSQLLEITYDESAEMRFLRHQTQEVSKDMEKFMISLARIIIDASSNKDKDILDVGCGDGLLIKYLVQAAEIDKKNFNCGSVTGIDLSTEMINLASSNYRNSHFYKANFLNFESDQKYNVIVMNECLHNFLSVGEALKKASNLLRENGEGEIVISHPRGYDNLVNQYSKNRQLVPSLLPKTETEWMEILENTGDLKLKIKKFYSTNPYLIVLQHI